MTKERWLVALCVLGLLIHGVWWATLNQRAERYAEEVWDKMTTDRNYVPGYENWEPDWNRSLEIMFAVPCIYGPAILLSLIGGVVAFARGHRPRLAVFIFGASVGALSLPWFL